MKQEIINIDNIWIRNEDTGVSIYDIDKDLYLFFDNTNIDDSFKTSKQVYDYLIKNNKTPSIPKNYYAPVRINYLVTNICNLNCIYCFADNKMSDELIHTDLSIIDKILSYNPLSIALSGGEPMLSRQLHDIVNKASGKVAILIDSNGTIPFTNELIASIKKAKALVRISLDAADSETNGLTRPTKNNEIFDITNIINNIKLLLNNDVSVNIHTVVTKLNQAHLEELCRLLIDLSINRLHLYGVIKNGKARNIYEEIVVGKEELLELENKLQKQFPSLNITATPGLDSKSVAPSLMVDYSGKFFVEEWDNDPEYIGENPNNPTKEEICNKLNIANHLEAYYSLAIKHKDI